MENKEELIKYLSKYKRASYTIADYYLSYLKYIEQGTVYDVDYPIFKEILTEYFQMLRDEMLEESRTIKLPCRLGTITIIKKPPKTFTRKSLAIDFRESRLQGKLVFHLNEHSNYYKYRAHWAKKDALVKGRFHYQFIMTRSNKRRLAQIIKNKEHDFTELY